MDPTTWPMWLKLLAGWGPLGIWAGISEIRRVWAERAHHATRDKGAKLMAEVVERHELEATVMRDSYVQMVRDLTEEHQKQLHEVTRRFVHLLERQSEKAHALIDKVEEKNPTKLLPGGSL
jgi:hypothetical protein